MQTICLHTPRDAVAILSYALAGGAVNRYPTGARALPPTYTDASARKPRFYCVHAPVKSYPLADSVERARAYAADTYQRIAPALAKA